MKARGVLCLVLIFTTGCRSVYRFRCTSAPAPAGVLVGDEFVGETPCRIEVPRNSEWIEDGWVTLTFCLPDGREKVRLIDLGQCKASSPLAEIVSLPFAVVGLGLLWLATHDDEEEEDESDSLFPEDEDDDDNDTGLFLAGLAVAGLGLGVYVLLGGDFEYLHSVHVDFDESVWD